MSETELDWLARHMGHDIRVHREYYRLHESHIELAKVGKWLFAVDSGKAHKYAGKRMDEVELDGKDNLEYLYILGDTMLVQPSNADTSINVTVQQ